MEASHSLSSGPSHEDSWTCRRCHWVYPNPHPSAKHRRNHKKQCGKIKGFELRSELHKGGSSDEVSSDDESHGKTDHLPPQSPEPLQAIHQAISPAATGSPLPDLDHPVAFVEKEICTDSAANEQQARDVSVIKDDAPDGLKAVLPNLQGVSTNSDVKSGDPAPEFTLSMASLDEPSKVSLGVEQKESHAASVDEADVVSGGSPNFDIDQTKESYKQENNPNSKENMPIDKVDAGGTKIDQHDLWICHDCGWTYPNAHPSAKHRRNHKKHCNKVRGSSRGSMQVSSVGGGSSEEVSSDEENSHHGLHVHKNRGSSVTSLNTVTPMPKDLHALAPQESDENHGQRSEGHMNRLGEGQDGLSGHTPEEASMNRLGEGQDGLSGHTPEEASISVSAFLSSDASPQASVVLHAIPPASFQKGQDGLGHTPEEPNISSISASSSDTSPLASVAVDVFPPASTNELDESRILVPAIDSGKICAGDESFDAATGMEPKGVMSKEESGEAAGVFQLDTSSKLEDPKVLNDGSVDDPHGKAKLETLAGGLARGGEGLALHEVLSDSPPSHTFLSADTYAENKSMRENFLPSPIPPAAEYTVLTKGGEEEERLVNEQFSEHPAELMCKDALSSGGAASSKDDAFDTEEKPDQTPMETIIQGQPSHPMDFLGALKEDSPQVANSSWMMEGISDSVDEVATLKAPISPADVSGESIEQSLHKPGKVMMENVDVLQGVIPTSEVLCAETTCMEDTKLGSTPQDTGLFEIAKESDFGGIPSKRDIGQDNTAEAICSSKVLKESDFEGHIQGKHLCETRDAESLEISSIEQNGITGSDTGSVQQVVLRASAPGRSDSLETEVYEDAPDSLETCSVGGSIEENEISDELHQSLDGRQEGSNSLVMTELDEKPNVLDHSNAPELVSEEKTTILPGKTYAVTSETQDLKAPSPEAWQEPGTFDVGSESNELQAEELIQAKNGKISSSEVKEDGKSGKSHTPLRSLLAEEGPEKTDQSTQTSNTEGPGGSKKFGGSWGSRNGTKTKARSIWSHCICCPAVH